VFEDYVKFRTKHGAGVRYLPTPAFYYGMDVGQNNVSTRTVTSLECETLQRGAEHMCIR
jgi:hypothetical protein